MAYFEGRKGMEYLNAEWAGNAVQRQLFAPRREKQQILAIPRFVDDL